MNEFAYSIDFIVRDYECDIQGIVNNAVYQNYLEHARHQYLKSIGIDFAAFAQQGINLVVIRVELDYKFPLKSGDAFTIKVQMERISPLKIVFHQDIFRESDNKLILKGKVFGTALNKRGRPEMPDMLTRLFDNQIPQVTTGV